MDTNQVVDLLLSKETEVLNKFHQAISEILRLGYDTDRGKEQIPDMINSIQYPLEEIDRIINRWMFSFKAIGGKLWIM